ncbi:MAG: ATP-binding cassette domain-containing protein [Deltaproteobacteria bacterium]|nr:ATP-binding cassette domain-containing protein [Deltaproteobacteria bacterium]
MIHAEDLVKYYNDLCAVDHISFDIQKGEIVGLLGPNGAGKTTTLRMLTGYLMPTSGSILVGDYNINENPLEIKKMLGYLPESAPLYHDMLVYDYLNYVADIRELDSGKKRSRIRELADLCGIGEVMHQTIGELSKGYKQRVGLAHAMMNDPEILVLDEPTSGLDPNQIIEIRDIIKEIGKEKTIILSTHILSEAEATCDRMMIINNGKIVADDSTEVLKESAGGEALIKITLKNTDFAAAKAEFEGIDGVTEITGDDTIDGHTKLTLKSRSNVDIREEIYNHIKQSDWVLLELFQETRTLETVFRELTKE